MGMGSSWVNDWGKGVEVSRKWGKGRVRADSKMSDPARQNVRSLDEFASCIRPVLK